MRHEGMVNDAEQERNDGTDDVTSNEQLDGGRGAAACGPYCPIVSSCKDKVEKSKA